MYPKKTAFREIRPLTGNFSGMRNHVSRATTWTRVLGKFGGNRSKESGESGASFPSQKNNSSSATHFFALSTKRMARFRWKRSMLSYFRPQPHLLSFIQIHPSFRDLLAKTTFQIVTVYSFIHHKTNGRQRKKAKQYVPYKKKKKKLDCDLTKHT